jgi:hypothetical protein
VTPFVPPTLDLVRLCRVAAGVSGPSPHLFRSVPGVSSKSPSVATASSSWLKVDRFVIWVTTSSFLPKCGSAAEGEGVERMRGRGCNQ